MSRVSGEFGCYPARGKKINTGGELLFPLLKLLLNLLCLAAENYGQILFICWQTGSGYN